MKKVFRNQLNSDYWEERWLNSGVDESDFENEDIYPIKYAKKVINDNEKILEAGCGAGRVYFYYKKRGFDISGIEYSKNAVNNIQKIDIAPCKVMHGSVTDMPYEDNFFDVVLAFGLYHNIEDEKELQKAFNETKRVLNNGGKLVASVRIDSLENNIVENIFKKRNGNGGGMKFDKFHKWHFSLEDIKHFLGKDMIVEQAYYARNVSFLFKYDFFRAKEFKTKKFQESKARSIGFKLNFFGRILDKLLHGLFSKHFSNLLVVIARKEM